MIIFRKMRRALLNYDPYGLYRVIAAQAAFVAVGLFLINFAYNIPDFEKIYSLPAFGLLAVGRQPSFLGRIRSMAVFCFVTLLYAILLTFAQTYQYLVVSLVAIMMLTLFIISKKYSFLLPMIPLINLTAYVFLVIPYGGDWSKILVFSYSCLIIIGCALILMYVFPRIYFFRIWLSSFHATLTELEEKCSELIAKQKHPAQDIFVDLINMQDYAYALSYKEYGFAARKIALRCMSVYVFIIAVLYDVQAVTNEELVEISLFLSQLRRALPLNKPLDHFNLRPSDNEQIVLIQTKLVNMALEWNRLCRQL